MAQIGKILTILLGMVGGLCAVLFGFAILALLFISAASVRIPGEGTEDRLIDLANGSFWYIYLGFAGIVGVVLVYINRQRPGAMLLLGTGVLGFIVSYAGSSTLMGTLTWIAPGALLILAGILALITPEKLGSILPLLKSDRQPVRRLGYAVYGIVLLLFLATLLSVGILSLGTIWTFSVSDFEPTSEKSPTADADRALVDGNIARSMGLWNESNISYDRAINDYDKIIEKDPINAQAWKNKAFAQKQLGRHNDSLKSYENYLELNKSDSYTWRVKAEILKDLGRDAEAEAAIAKANDIDIASVNL